jgi:hypothetical protein
VAVNVVRTFGFTRPLNPGILISKFIAPLFLPPVLALGLDFLAVLDWTFSASFILKGCSPISLMRPMASFWLATSIVPFISLPLESSAT